MANATQSVQPRYQQIAIGIAERIVEGRYVEGEKLRARSTIAMQFQVSPETARKAITILADLSIVEVKHGSGFFVSSKARAQEFIKQHQDVRSLTTIKQDLNHSIKRQQSESKEFITLLNKLVDQTKRFNEDNTLIPYELLVTEDFEDHSKNISELNFWHNTGATIVAVKHKNKMIVSPGPLAKIEVGDVIYFVGDEFAYQRVVNLLMSR
ncbi:MULTISPECIES: GntR family transcriptional regulator [Holzapfeliella]|uniref:GntR family transcriptional regulator n=1 Tax=Holzapfeliella saturejae TaxID=3082953 RepID=A0ABU8SF53_9LACO